MIKSELRKKGAFNLLLSRLLCLLLLYSLSRLLFLLFNFDYFQDVSFNRLGKSFILGIRFDVIIVVAINSLFITLSLLPHSFQKSPGYQKFLKVFFIATNAPFIFLNLTDLEYFKFTGKRTTFDVVKMYEDIINQGLQLLTNYWFILALSVLLIAILTIFYPGKKVQVKVMSKIPGYATLIVILGVSFLIIRGSTELRPITLKQAFAVTPVKLGHLVLNTPFSFFYTIQAKGVEPKNYFSHWDDIYSVINRKPVRINEQPETKQNVVIIILESFSREYIGYGNSHKGYTPFLDSLSEHSTFFPFNFANGRKSIESLPAILAGIPALMDEPYINSVYQNNNIYGLGNALKPYGYHTSFFHGGLNGTMGFDAFSALAGFDEYYGKNEYPEPDKDYDGKWGIYDEPFLQFFAKKLSGFPEPFCSSVFTLTSHPPYPIPEKYSGKFPKGDLPIHETIGYTDYSLKKFFARAKKEPWYANTLFIITADHTQEHFEESYKNELGDYLVPLILFSPMGKIKADTTQITQHADILPTVLDYLKIQAEEYNLFGKSVFREGNSFALNQTNGIYRMIQDDYLFQYSDQGFRVSHNSFVAPSAPPSISDSLQNVYLTQLKAYVQYFNNGLIENKLFLKEEESGEEVKISYKEFERGMNN